MAAPGLPRAEYIFQHIKTTLESITIANGYLTDIGTVSRGILSPLETFGLPLASILPATDEPTEEIGAQWNVLTVGVWS